MDDDKKNQPRKGGFKKAGDRKPAGVARSDGSRKFGKPVAAGGGKPFGKKPYAARPAEGASTGERPKRDFRARDGEARPERSEAPFRKGPKREGGDLKPREGGSAYKPREGGSARPGRFDRKTADGAASGEAKPYRARREDGDRPNREFRPRDGEARAQRSDTPYRKGPPREGGDFKPREGGSAYKPREGGAARPGRFERKPADGAGGDAKPYRARREDGDRPNREFRPREGGEGKPFRPRREEGERAPREFQRSERPRDGEARPPRGDRPFRSGPRPEGRRDEDRGFEKRDSAPRKFAPRSTEEEVEPGERIAKRLARAGIASRRDAEELIAAGRVRVNGKVLASPAFNVMPEDVIHLDETLITAPERTRLFLFHKPSGVVTTNRDPEGRKTVFDVLPEGLPRLMTIGRLDINTEGLLLLTNDGGLSRVLELPATGWLRRYRVRVHGKVEQKTLDGLKDGIAVDGVFYGSIEATLDREQGSNAWITIGLREGKNREVKNILGALGLDVNRLIRISYGPFQLGELAEGHVQEIKGRTLRDQLGDKLVEESGANFEADIATPFSNRPVKRNERPDEEVPAKPRIMRDGERGRIGEGGLIKNRKRDQERHREDMLGRLSTKPDRGAGGGKFAGKPAGGGRKKDDRDQKPIDPPGVRKANVWMAPGARPQGAKSAPSRPPRDDDRGGDKPRGRPSGDRPRGPRKDRP